jgi:hypothetical protein
MFPADNVASMRRTPSHHTPLHQYLEPSFYKVRRIFSTTVHVSGYLGFMTADRLLSGRSG